MAVTFTTHLARTFTNNGKVITETVEIGPTNVDNDQRTMFEYFCDVMNPRHQLDYYRLKFRPPPFYFQPTGDLLKIDNECLFNLNYINILRLFTITIFVRILVSCMLDVTCFKLNHN